jgi:dolichyl-phosphate-mannose--protein O-mannosyl transferase
VLFATFILKQKRIKVSYLLFIVIPVVVYIASYLPMFTTGHAFDIFWGMQKQMWWYHTGLVATHPFSSPWWSWPVLGRPIWLYTSGEHQGLIDNIYAMGNPIIFWGGLISIFVSTWYALKDKSRALAVVVVAYAGMFMPWALSPRIMFLYHYFPAVPFMCISLAYALSRSKKTVFPFLLIALIVFLYFYPRLIGLPIPLWLNDSYYWLPSWR